MDSNYFELAKIIMQEIPPLPALLAAAAGPAFHFSLRNKEVDFQLKPLFAGYAIALSLITYVLSRTQPLTTALSTVFLLFAIFTTTLSTSIIVYRLFSHRIRTFPGPIASAISR